MPCYLSPIYTHPSSQIWTLSVKVMWPISVMYLHLSPTLTLSINVMLLVANIYSSQIWTLSVKVMWPISVMYLHLSPTLTLSINTMLLVANIYSFQIWTLSVKVVWPISVMYLHLSPTLTLSVNVMLPVMYTPFYSNTTIANQCLVAVHLYNPMAWQMSI